MFVGREQELSLLRDLYDRKNAALAVCKGRRRIGKSTLIQQFAQSSAHFYEFQGLAPRDGISDRDQLTNFSRQVSAQFGLTSTFPLENWTQAFELLSAYIPNGRTVLLLDEISWMGGQDLDFAGTLKIAWDIRFKKHSKLILVLCGSVSSWIEENVLNDTGFVGRVSLSIHLEELPPGQCVAFWGKKRKRFASFEMLKILAVTGGVPKYLEEIKTNASAEDNIAQLCFRKEGLLFSEFDNIFNSIFSKRASLYKEIVRILVSTNRTFSQICDQLSREQSGVISRYLADLEASGFISRDYAWSTKGTRTRLSKYRLKDNYLRFYLKYIDPVKEQIADNIYGTRPLERLPGWDSIIGLQFENLVLNNIPFLLQVLSISPTSVLNASPYFQNKTNRHKGCQIDLLIQTKNTIYVAEIKLRKKIPTAVIEEVREKIRRLKPPRIMSVRPILIYEGELAASIPEDDFFDKLICFSDLLETP